MCFRWLDDTFLGIVMGISKYLSAEVGRFTDIAAIKVRLFIDLVTVCVYSNSIIEIDNNVLVRQ